MAQQMKRTPHKPDHSSHACPWCGGRGWKWANTTEKTKCQHCWGKCKVSSEKAATYKDSWVAQRRKYLREQKEKPKRMNTTERVRSEITDGWNPKD